MFKLRHCIAVLLPMLLIACAGRGGPGGNSAAPEVYAPDDPSTMTSAVTEDGRPAWMPPPLYKMETGARIGIMSVVENQIRVGSGSKTIYPGFDLTGYAANSLRKALFSNTPYGAILLPPSARLMAERSSWQQSWNPKTQTFATEWQTEFDAIIKQNGLAMLVIISQPPISEGGLSGKLQGSGYTTRGLFSSEETVAYSSMQFFRIHGKPGKLLQPTRANDDALYSVVPNFPKGTLPDPLPKPMLGAIERQLMALIDQKATRFVNMMK